MTISQTKLFELLNAQVQPPVPFTPANVQLLNPVANAGASWNTRLTLQAVPNRGYVNDALVYYYRVNLADLGTQEFQRSEIASAAALVAALNTRLNAWLDVTDLEAFVIPTDEGVDENLTLTAAADSLGWVGSMPVVLKAGAALTVVSTDPYDNGSALVITTTFTLAAPAASDVTFDVATEADTALEDVHFLAKSATVTIPEGQTSASFDTDIVYDSIVAAGDKFKLNVTNYVGTTGDAQYDVPVRPAWNVLQGKVVINDAGSRVARFLTELSPRSSVEQSVDWQTLSNPTSGTPAIPDEDFYAAGSSLVHAAEQLTGAFEVLVRVDDPAEDKTLAVMLTGQSGTTGMSRNIAQAEILIQQPILSVSDGVLRAAQSPGLGDREMVFTISLNQDGPVTFDYLTAQPGFTSYNDYGTAVKDQDYYEMLGFGVSLGGGNPTSMEVVVQIDTEREDNPYFFLELSNVSGARCERYRGKGIITPPGPMATISDGVFEELPPPATLEWYAWGADWSAWAPIAPSNSNTGSYPATEYAGRVLNEPAGVITWRKEWFPANGQPAPAHTAPSGPLPTNVEAGGANYAWGVTVNPSALNGEGYGEVRMYASVDGVELDGYLWITWADGAQEYSDTAWGWSNEA